MAVVYLAREDHPSRQVAIKVLEPTLTARMGHERFIREVDLASNLNHPHIVPIFAAGDAGGMLYYVMPFVAGESLHERLRRTGTLPMTDALRIVSDVADALEYAHQRNVVHRDIKPPNILLQGKHAVVTDFGIARAIRAAESESITETGMTLGTPAYMSPEQASGTGAIDGRADIYSLACVFFEMLTGAPPYGRRNSQEVLVRLVRDPVPSVRAADKSIDVELDEVVTKALAKSPDQRYATALDFLRALEAAASQAVTGVTTPMPAASEIPASGSRAARWFRTFGRAFGSSWLPRAAVLVTLGAVATLLWRLLAFNASDSAVAESRFVDSVAVMPIENLSGDPQYDHLGTGITDEIITHLSQIPRLKVISRHSSEAMAGAQLTTPQLLDTLGVGHIVEGSLQVQGNQIRLTVQHIDSTDAHLGSETYRADLDDWLEVQEQIASQFTAEFVQRIDGLSISEVASHAGHSPGHESYLLGEHLLARRTPNGIRRAIALFEEAITADPAQAAAYAGLSTAHALALTYRYRIGVPEYRSAAIALATANRALSLDSNRADAYAARGFITMLARGPVEEAATDFERAHELQPSSASAHSWYSRVLAQKGNVEAAFEEVERAISLDPLNPGRRIALAYLALHMKRYDIAVRATASAVNIEADLMLPRAIQARSFLLMGEALQCAQMSLGPHAVIRAMCLHELGRRTEAAAVVDSVIAAMESDSDHDDSFTDVVRAEDLAVFYAWLGDVERSLQWALRAYEQSPVGVEVRVLESALFDRVRRKEPFGLEIERVRDGIWDRVQRETKVLTKR